MRRRGLLKNGVMGAGVLAAGALPYGLARLRPVVKQACAGCGLGAGVCPHPGLPIRVVERSKVSVAIHEGRHS